MRCQPCREALSARLDNEEPGVPDEVVERHLAGCAECRSYRDRSRLVRRRFAVRPADAVPDLTGPILAAARTPVARPGVARSDAAFAPVPSRRSPGGHWTRWALLAVALTQLAIAVPPLVLGPGDEAPGHLARELGAWDVALAAALVLVVLRPARAAGLVPFAALLAMALVGAAAIDVVTGRASILAETQHLVELAGLALLWVTARRAPDPRPLLDGFGRHRPSLAAS